MRAVELTFEQVLRAVRRWPTPRRRALVSALSDLPPPDEVLGAARRLRPGYRMGPKKRRRLAELLAKGNAGTLSPEERRELDGLVEEFEVKTLALGQALFADRLLAPPKADGKRAGRV